jgi:hypothetical protein
LQSPFYKIIAAAPDIDQGRMKGRKENYTLSPNYTPNFSLNGLKGKATSPVVKLFRTECKKIIYLGL